MQSLPCHYIIITSSLEHFYRGILITYYFSDKYMYLISVKTKNTSCNDTVNNIFIANLQLKSTLWLNLTKHIKCQPIYYDNYYFKIKLYALTNVKAYNFT